MGNFDTKIAKIKTALENVFLKKSDASETYQLKGNYATSNHTHTTGSITDFPSTMTPSSHTHGDITNDGKIGSTSGKPIITTTGGKLATGTFGTSSGQFAEGNHSHNLNNLLSADGHNAVADDSDGVSAYFLDYMLYYDGNDATLSLFDVSTADYSKIATIDDIPQVPDESNTIPSADIANGSIGTGTTWAKADHQHPLSSAYATASHTHSDTEITPSFVESYWSSSDLTTTVNTNNTYHFYFYKYGPFKYIDYFFTTISLSTTSAYKVNKSTSLLPSSLIPTHGTRDVVISASATFTPALIQVDTDGYLKINVYTANKAVTVAGRLIYI